MDKATRPEDAAASGLLALRAAMYIQHAAAECTRKYVEGMHIGQIESLRHIHYDRPLWGLTDYFQAVAVEPEEVVQIVRRYQPGPHLIGVMTHDIEANLAPYAALGYRPVFRYVCGADYDEEPYRLHGCGKNISGSGSHSRGTAPLL